MAKTGLTLDTCGGCLRSTANASGWSLCIGAGSSLPVFPLWGELVADLLQTAAGGPLDPAVFQNLKSGFSLDALIQAIYGKSRLPSYQSAQSLSRHLYQRLKAKCSKAEWLVIRRFFATKNNHAFERHDCEELLAIFYSHFKSCTALQLAEVLGKSIVAKLAPSNVVTFNAEPLLQTLATAYIRANTKLPRTRYFDACLRGLITKSKNRIGVYYCHGLLPLPGERVRSSTSSVEKLVFSETEYLSLAGSAFSWQSAVFLNTAMSHTMVFVGVSFSDPNLRRWLGFVHSNRMRELAAVGQNVVDSNRHYWIHKKPASAEEQVWIERVVSHLGVRLVWIESWSHVREALMRMLSL
jgi:hypothetical protein